MNPSTNAPIYYGPSNNGTDSALLAAMATKDYQYDYPGMIGAGGICDLREEVKDVGSNVRSDIGDVKMTVKDGDGNILSKLGDVECRVTGKVSDLEARVLTKLGEVECKVIKENSDQTLYLTNQLSVIREQGIRNEYETKLSREQVIKELGAKIDHKYERLSDQLNHGFEEVQEKLCDCCGEAAVVATRQDGFLNLLVDALNVK